MKEMKESIAVMQHDLNALLACHDNKINQSAKVYSLSVLLDEEIVRYYRNLSRAKCS